MCGASAMSGEDDFRIRPGRIRSTRAQQARPFIAQALAAAKAQGVKTMVAFNNIKTPAAMLAKQLIDRGDIGTPTRFRGWFDQGFYSDPDLPWSWRTSRRDGG